jgi:tetratricopeptide (TPR) repeat protein
LKRSILYFTGFLSTVLVLFSACVTQKSKNDLSGIGKLYHNTTAKYNGYFNAREIFNTTLLELQLQHQDNYQQNLVVYPYMAIKDPKTIGPKMDLAIEKVTRVVALHPRSQWTDDCYLMVGKAQFLKQDFESAEETLRFMAGEFDPERPASRKSRISAVPQNAAKERAQAAAAKAKARKQQQKEREKAAKEKQKAREKAAKEKARQRKQYNKAVQRARKQGTTVTKPSPYAKPKPGTEPPPVEQDPKKLAEAAKKKAKEEEARQKAEAKKQQPDNYFMKHRPAYQEGILWLARTLIERENTESALRLIRQLVQNPKTLPFVKEQAWPALAYLYLKKEEPDEAVMPLEQAIASDAPRLERGRYAFILAQLHEAAGRWEQAGKAYGRAIGLASSYDMEFRARLNMTLNNFKAGSASMGDTRLALEKLLADEKNTGFKDQIYFTLSSLALQSQDRAAAIENLRLSLASSNGNPSQKAESYLAISQLYIASEEYLEGKLYLDSTLAVISPQDPRVPDIQKQINNLKDIADYILKVQQMDTLLKISYMSDEEKRKLASTIKKAEDERRLAALAARDAPAAPLATAQRRDIGVPALNQQDQASSFFAYNERNLKRGERDFFIKWGSNRKLEDNWRRINKKSASSDNEETGAVVAETTKDAKGDLLLTPEEIDNILGNVPKTEGDKKVMEYKLAEAMFKLGALYQERLQNNPKSIEILEKMLERLPGNNYVLDAWYYLYLAYKNSGDPAKANYYAELLKDKYPSSKYALMITNPAYAKTMVDRELEINQFYDEAYLAFQQERFEEVMKMCEDARPKYGIDNPLRARFAMLSAFCTGKMQGKEAYMAALSDVAARFPDTEEQKQAREILRILGNTTANLPGGQKAQVEADDAVFSRGEEEQIHYIIIAGDAQMNINDAKNAVSDFNRKYYRLEKLSLTNMFIGQDEDTRTPVIIIRRFNNGGDAMKYYETAVSNQSELVPGARVEVMAISLDNYRELIRLQSVSEYLRFFKANY